MKRPVLIVVAAVIAAGLGAYAVAVSLVSTDTVRNAVLAEIRAATGLNPIVRGPISVAVFPSGAVHMADVVLGTDGDSMPALSAEGLTARLRFFALMTGRIEIADVALERPRIVVHVAPDGTSNWSALLQRLARALAPDVSARERVTALSEIRIKDGTVLVHDGASTATERLEAVDVSLAWPSISKSFTATGRFVWHNEPLEGSLAIGDFLAALTGNNAGLKLRLSGAPINAAFEGTMSTRPSLKIEGTLAVDSPSLREAVRWASGLPLPGGGFGRFALKARTNIVGGSIALSGVNLELDGNSAEGVLSYTYSDRKTWQGTLAAEGLNLTPYISTARLLAASARDWDRMPLTLDGLTGFDVDLRLSAQKVTIAHAQLGRTAIAANLRSGKLVVTVGESQAFNGLIKGSIALGKSEAGADFRSQMQLSNVDLEACLGDLFGIRRLEGKGTINVALEGAGASVLGITRTLTGSIHLAARQGHLNGVNVEQLLRRLERRPLSGGGDFRSGRTPYQKLTIALKITEGTASAEDITLEGTAIRLAMGGSASIPLRDLDLKGTASLLNASAETTFELPFVVQGPWDNPLILPDPQSLIRRSGAAAPLLEALRDKKAREAVRSAIERLTGAPVAPWPTAVPGLPAPVDSPVPADRAR